MRLSTYQAIGTGYYPDASPLEGGYVDRHEFPLHTLQDFLFNRSPYVSVAMDVKAFPYGTPLRIPELEVRYCRQITFLIVDTGSAFRDKGTTRIDICCSDHTHSEDSTINGPLTLMVIDPSWGEEGK